ncbi:MAG TPA: ABC transporter permease [Dehalococcoidia bacterium]|nr:ABC transporter permease [Dehalococcoidia bacterium]
MAVTSVAGWELEGYERVRERALPVRALAGVWSFARRKPLGFACGIVLLVLVIIGDLFTFTINNALRLAGLESDPIPYVADLVAPYPYTQGVEHIRHGHRLQPTILGEGHVLGTDNQGRDVLSRIIYGSRVTVVIGFGAVAISVVLSASIAIVSGYYMGWVDKIGQRVVDIFQSLPGLAVLITVFGVFGRGWLELIVVIGIVVGVPGSRIIRSQVLSVMASPYVEAARTIGAGDWRIMTRYVLPNVMALIILAATFRLGSVVLLEATLSFLGFGVPPPFPSWGQMLSLDGREFMRAAPGLAIFPGLAIGLAVFSFNLFGDALRDVWDPRLRGSR